MPVSPLCNIQCRFCKRGFNKQEHCPGVSRGLLKPAEAVGVLEKALKLCPDITVVGIAGPGDTLAGDYALDTFRLVHQRYPELIKCLSTNGLLLKEKAEGLAGAGVKTITVTMNAVDIKTLAQICSHITFNGQYITGEVYNRGNGGTVACPGAVGRH
ncbi:radical SAM protein [Sporomusa carbonis]|uniref:radical SAM protein n=1 Tax=Sporomusa carbonis TaxID=3076075 RepID=UPI003C7C2432